MGRVPVFGVTIGYQDCQTCDHHVLFGCVHFARSHSYYIEVQMNGMKQRYRGISIRGMLKKYLRSNSLQIRGWIGLHDSMKNLRCSRFGVPTGWL
jgi:hypothetical protein